MLTIEIAKLYTHEIKDDNFDREFPFKKFIFDFQIEGTNSFFCITFDKIPSYFRLKRFVDRFSKDYNLQVNFYHEDTNLVRHRNGFLREFIRNLIKERKCRLIEKEDDYKSYKVFINGERVYNQIIMISMIRINNKDVIQIESDKAWNGPIANNLLWHSDGYYYRMMKRKEIIAKHIRFSNIRF